MEKKMGGRRGDAAGRIQNCLPTNSSIQYQLFQTEVRTPFKIGGQVILIEI